MNIGKLLACMFFCMTIHLCPAELLGQIQNNAETHDEATITCKYCKGRGKLIDVSTTKKTAYLCTICNGQGKISPIRENTCPECEGLKRVPMVLPDSGVKDVAAPVTNKRSGVISARLIGQACSLCAGSGSYRVN
jgi:DNA-directed RNA polymerase subunit RPC12/RpoP